MELGIMMLGSHIIKVDPIACLMFKSYRANKTTVFNYNKVNYLKPMTRYQKATNFTTSKNELLEVTFCFQADSALSTKNEKKK